MRSPIRNLSTQDLPAQPFFQTPEQRAALARQRYFEEQQHPAGLVSEAVIRSWGRSRSLGHASRLMLTDAAGVIVHVSRGTGDPQQKVLDVATRVGVNLAEEVLGTTAPGIVVQTGMACTVQGCEHFYDMFGSVRCAAAPIRDVHGRLVGVLDVSTEARGFGFDAAAVVGVYATSIENRLLQAQSDQHLVLHFQAAPALLGTPMEGLAGVDSQGQVVWLNATGHSLLGRPSRQGTGSVGEFFGTDLGRLVSMCGATEAQRMQLPSGLGIWVRATLGLRDGVDFRHAVAWSASPPAPAPEPEAVAVAEPETPAAPAPAAAPSLADTQQRLIGEALLANGGNVARTARQLGVSRGLVYRHLRR